MKSTQNRRPSLIKTENCLILNIRDSLTDFHLPSMSLLGSLLVPILFSKFYEVINHPAMFIISVTLLNYIPSLGLLIYIQTSEVHLLLLVGSSWQLPDADSTLCTSLVIKVREDHYSHLSLAHLLSSLFPSFATHTKGNNFH